MAARQSTSNARARRNGATSLPSKGTVGKQGRPLRPASRGSRNGGGMPAVQGRPFGGLEEVLKHERVRLADAQSVLGCLHAALLHAEGGVLTDDLDYAHAAGMALAIVRGVANRLDSAYVGPLVEALGSARPFAGKSLRQRR